jgi:hypothetical protein
MTAGRTSESEIGKKTIDHTGIIKAIFLYSRIDAIIQEERPSYS